MKQIILTLAIVFSGILMQAQINDIDIATAIMGKQADSLRPVADSLGIELDFDGNDKIFVTVDGTTIVYKITAATYYKKISIGMRQAISNVIIAVFIRYKHSAYKHFSRFKAANIPEQSDLYEYEKKQGRNVSHIEIKTPY